MFGRVDISAFFTRPGPKVDKFIQDVDVSARSVWLPRANIVAMVSTE